MPIPVGNYVMIVDRGDARSLTVVDAHTRGIRNNEARVRGAAVGPPAGIRYAAECAVGFTSVAR
jgi:hypothetical protein